MTTARTRDIARLFLFFYREGSEIGHDPRALTSVAILADRPSERERRLKGWYFRISQSRLVFFTFCVPVNSCTLRMFVPDSFGVNALGERARER